MCYGGGWGDKDLNYFKRLINKSNNNEKFILVSLLIIHLYENGIISACFHEDTYIQEDKLYFVIWCFVRTQSNNMRKLEDLR